MGPNRELMRLYGTEDVFLEKQAGMAPLLARMGWGAARFEMGKHDVAHAQEQKAQAEELNQIARELEPINQASEGLRHTRAPVFVAPDMPRRGGRGMGLEDVPVGMDEGMVRLASIAIEAGQTLAKQAGVGEMLMNFGKSLGPAAAASGAAGAAGAGGGLMARLGKDLGGGKWKWKLPALAGGAAATFGAVKGLKAGLNWLGKEPTPYSYNQGGPQLAYGVNQYGYPQLGG